MTDTMTSLLPPSLRLIERGWLSSNSLLADNGDGSAWVVDSGYAGQAADTVELIREALGGKRLTRLLNTHSHSDHIGGNAALKAAFGCTIAIPAGIEEHVRQWNEEALFLAPSDQRGDPFEHDLVLHAGDTFRMGGLDWVALAAPGHDMDALIFHCPSERLLISGDALWQDGFGAVFAELLGTGPGLAATRETLEHIAALNVAVVIPGHGPAFDDVPAALERAYRRLDAFAADPQRMARNALKACFTFNLLDRQRLPLSALPGYLASVPFFCRMGETLDMDDSHILAAWLLEELVRSRSIRIDAGWIVPTMAA
jgi:glyoxylase-like metal-dependent hydrolase (beta-lactamase superfamily II)